MEEALPIFRELGDARTAAPVALADLGLPSLLTASDLPARQRILLDEAAALAAPLGDAAAHRPRAASPRARSPRPTVTSSSAPSRSMRKVSRSTGRTGDTWQSIIFDWLVGSERHRARALCHVAHAHLLANVFR